eukprot:TRINITY_DN24264_c0_g1_i6.p1 TRINITY_DN24264_c0_g1~~TRINITY_DN24264_c0_g1_i6.p1  ORF type:complete len:117 (-),score=17.91 TRINITY_DN24264_c0_g1_i6:336-686(-)
MIAVFFSLISSICLVVERAGKFSQLAFSYNSEYERKVAATQRFLALSGPYSQFGSLKEAYPSYMDSMAQIGLDVSRARIFGSGLEGGGHGHHVAEDKATPMKKEGGAAKSEAGGEA